MATNGAIPPTTKNTIQLPAFESAVTRRASAPPLGVRRSTHGRGNSDSWQIILSMQRVGGDGAHLAGASS